MTFRALFDRFPLDIRGFTLLMQVGMAGCALKTIVHFVNIDFVFPGYFRVALPAADPKRLVGSIRMFFEVD
jgi:hypothetical protein